MTAPAERCPQLVCARIIGRCLYSHNCRAPKEGDDQHPGLAGGPLPGSPATLEAA